MNVGNVAFLKQKSISLLRNKVCYTPKKKKCAAETANQQKSSGEWIVSEP